MRVRSSVFLSTFPSTLVLMIALVFCSNNQQVSATQSLFVDDFKIVGLAQNIPAAWKELGKHLELDPPTEFHGGTYLGQTQFDVHVNEHLVAAQSRRWNDLYQDVRVGTYDSSMGNMTAKDQKHRSETLSLAVDLETANGILDPYLDHVESIEPVKSNQNGKKKQKVKSKAKVEDSGKTSGTASVANRTSTTWESERVRVRKPTELVRSRMSEVVRVRKRSK